MNIVNNAEFQFGILPKKYIGQTTLIFVCLFELTLHSLRPLADEFLPKLFMLQKV